jgi:hypothetical protein
LFVIFLLGSCAIQEKSIELANGEMVTQKKYDRMIGKAFKSADKEARKSVKGKMSRKEIKEFRENITVVVDTLGN